MISIEVDGDGFYIVECDEKVTVLAFADNQWYDHISGDYSPYDINPSRIIEKIKLPLKDLNND